MSSSSGTSFSRNGSAYGRKILREKNSCSTVRNVWMKPGRGDDGPTWRNAWACVHLRKRQEVSFSPVLPTKEGETKHRLGSPGGTGYEHNDFALRLAQPGLAKFTVACHGGKSALDRFYKFALDSIGTPGQSRRLAMGINPTALAPFQR